MENELVYTAEGLDELVNRALVVTVGGDVWQKLADREQGIAETGYGFVWFQPGSADAVRSIDIELPARRR